MHVGLILDGNRKYAKKKKIFPSYKGHTEGKNALEKILFYWAKQKEPEFLTLYVFSYYNLKKRNKLERYFILNLIKREFKKLLDVKEIFDEEIKVVFLGNKEMCPKGLLNVMDEIEKKTKKHKNKTLAICVCYDGQEELVEAIKKIKDKKIKNITRETIKNNIYSNELPHLDLVIRTGGEKRLSGFMLWDSSYSELIFKKKTWPEYTIKDFKEDIKEFKDRKRRFGK